VAVSPSVSPVSPAARARSRWRWWHVPGDFKIRPLGGAAGCLIMILISVVLSIVLTVLVNLIR